MSDERDVLTGDVPQVAPRDEPVRRETLRDVVREFVAWVDDSPLSMVVCGEWAIRMREAMERDDKEGSR